MSHFKERDEKICLNCNTPLHGRYCHLCGQENREPKETVWGLITHFFYDITHFDGKFFTSTGRLIARPGLLPKEYINGRRAAYINPIRMYIFSSAVFFIIFFSLFDTGSISGDSKYYKGPAKFSWDTTHAATLQYARDIALENAKTRNDSMAIQQVYSQTRQLTDSLLVKDSATAKKKKKYSWNFSMDKSNFKTRKEYDSIQHSLPAADRDGWLKHLIVYRSIDLSQRYKDKENELVEDLLDKFMHTFPYLLFVSLPLYALFLKLLYVRRRRFYYVDHGIFLIYLYIFTFIFLLVYFAIMKLKDAMGWDWLFFLQLAMVLHGIYYAWRAMYKFYEQGRFKTVIKFLLLNVLATFSMIFLFSLFFILAIFNV